MLGSKLRGPVRSVPSQNDRRWRLMDQAGFLVRNANTTIQYNMARYIRHTMRELLLYIIFIIRLIVRYVIVVTQ